MSFTATGKLFVFRDKAEICGWLTKGISIAALRE